MSYIIYIDEVALRNEKEKNLTLPHNAPAIEKKTYPTKKDDPRINSKIRR
jgi:hypothetical protein